MLNKEAHTIILNESVELPVHLLTSYSIRQHFYKVHRINFSPLATRSTSLNFSRKCWKKLIHKLDRQLKTADVLFVNTAVCVATNYDVVIVISENIDLLVSPTGLAVVNKQERTQLRNPCSNVALVPEKKRNKVARMHLNAESRIGVLLDIQALYWAVLRQSFILDYDTEDVESPLPIDRIDDHLEDESLSVQLV